MTHKKFKQSCIITAIKNKIKALWNESEEKNERKNH